MQKCLRYLMHGEFRADYVNLREGRVPAEVFGLSEIRRALQFFSYTL